MRKRLLILGATTETIPLVKKAESMGIETFVADPFIDSPAKIFSSHPIEVDCFDITSLIKIIDSENIDGVLPGCADILIPSYEEVCRRTNKFCYVNRKIVQIFANKKGLKDLLRRYSLPVIKDYSYDEVTKVDFDKYPLFTKPTDNNSSKGMHIVYDRHEFDAAYADSLEHSRSKTVLIEQYKTCNDYFMGYILQDGKASVSFTADRFVNSEQRGVGTITAGMIYPSKFTELYYDTVHSKMLKIFDDIGFKNGILHIQGFVEDEKIMFYDPALRITGGQEYLFLERLCGVDLLKYLIHFSLTGSMSDEDISKLCDTQLSSNYVCNIAFSVKGCTIGKIDGIEYARNHKNVINVTQEHFSGDCINKVGTAQQNFSRMHIIAGSRAELKNAINDLQEKVIAYDEAGNNAMLKGLDANCWFNNEY